MTAKIQTNYKTIGPVELYAVGPNFEFGLGTGDGLFFSKPKRVPFPVDDITPFKKLENGIYNSFAIDNQDRLWFWGYNEGDLGNSGLSIGGADTRFSSPVQVGTNLWKDVSTGGFHSIAVRSDGTLWSWGRNNDTFGTEGALGLGDILHRSSPTQVGSASDWKFVSTGDASSFAVKNDGSAWGVGRGNTLGFNSAASTSTLVYINAGPWKTLQSFRSYTVGIKENGEMWSWGWNTDQGILGLGEVGFSAGGFTPNQIGSETNWVRVACTPDHYSFAALKNNGTLWSWGRNEIGNLGHGDILHRSVPTQVGALSNWADIRGMGYSYWATKTDGALWGWGGGYLHTLSSSSQVDVSSPILVSDLYGWKLPPGNGWTSSNATFEDLTPLDLGDRYISKQFLLENYPNLIDSRKRPGLFAWGAAGSGALGLNDLVNRSSPTQVGALTDWELISDGVAIKSDGTLWAWGDNNDGQLGLNDYDVNRSSPTQVGSLTNWKYVHKSYQECFAIKSDGTLWAWGINNKNTAGLYPTHSALGLGDLIHRSSPTQVGSDTNWKIVSFNSPQGAAIKTNGTLYTWGTSVYNSGQYGLLGLGVSNSDSSTPVQVGTLTNWKNISVGDLCNLALKNDGTIWSWGTNSFGQLGLGDWIHRSSPTQIGSDTDWRQVISGNAQSVAIKRNGTLWSWGTNSFGQLGHNDTLNRSTPVQVGLLANWKTVTLKKAFSLTLGIRFDGTLWSWGRETSGQLGLGDSNHRSSPTQIGSSNQWKQIPHDSTYYSIFAIKDGDY